MIMFHFNHCVVGMIMYMIAVRNYTTGEYVLDRCKYFKKFKVVERVLTHKHRFIYLKQFAYIQIHTVYA